MTKREKSGDTGKELRLNPKDSGNPGNDPIPSSYGHSVLLESLSQFGQRMWQPGSKGTGDLNLDQVSDEGLNMARA